MYSEDATTRGYNTFEEPPAYSDSVKNTRYRDDQQYHPLPNEPLQAPQRQTNITVIHQQPVVVCRAVVVCDEKPRNYLVSSIINLLFCCWCIGLVALMYSLKVDSDYAAGRISDAINASLMARRLNRIGFILFSLLFTVAIITATVIIVTNANDDDDDYDYNNYNN